MFISTEHSKLRHDLPKAKALVGIQSLARGLRPEEELTLRLPCPAWGAKLLGKHSAEWAQTLLGLVFLQRTG